MADSPAAIPSSSPQYASQDDLECHSGYLSVYGYDDATAIDGFGLAATMNGSQHLHRFAPLPFDGELADNYLANHPFYPHPVPRFVSTLDPLAPEALAFSLPPHGSGAGVDSYLNQADALHFSWDAPSSQAVWRTPTYPFATPTFHQQSSTQTLTSDATLTPSAVSQDPLIFPVPFHSVGQDLTPAMTGTLLFPHDAYPVPQHTPALSQEGLIHSLPVHPHIQEIHCATTTIERATVAPSSAARSFRRAARRVLSSPYSPALSSASSSDSLTPSPTLSHRSTSRPRRNRPVPTSSSSTASSDPESRGKCPHCTYVQVNGRGPELRRHIRTHTRPTDVRKALWICCGIPLADAARLGLPKRVMEEMPFEYNGVLFVGGCGKDFSRPDALGRHLKRSPGVCYGDRYGSYLRGNQEGAQ